ASWAEASQPPPSCQPLSETNGASRACQRARSPCKPSAICQLPGAANDVTAVTGSSSSTDKRSVPTAPDGPVVTSSEALSTRAAPLAALNPAEVMVAECAASLS